MRNTKSAAESAAEVLAGYLSIPEVSNALGVPYVTAYGLVTSGRLRAVRVGRSYMVDPASVEAMRLSRAAR